MSAFCDVLRAIGGMFDSGFGVVCFLSGREIWTESTCRRSKDETPPRRERTQTETNVI